MQRSKPALLFNMFALRILMFKFWTAFVFCAAAQTTPSYIPCPILGPRYPYPTGLLSSKPMQQTLRNLTEAFDKNITTGNTEYTATTPNTTSFSIGFFAANENGNNSQPFFYDYHYVAPSLRQSSGGLQQVNANSVYKLGGLTHLLTAYAFLAAVGEQYWSDPITKYVPELVNIKTGSIDTTSWTDIRLIDLATYTAGIPRTDSLNTIAKTNFPQDVARLFPPILTDYQSGSVNSTQSFLNVMMSRQPVYLPGTTPIYSDASYQLLALAIERAAGGPFSQVMMNRIFHPLNLSSTTVGTPSSVQNAVVPGNTTISGWQVSAQDSFLFADNSMFSTIHDMSIIGRSIVQSSLIPPAATRRWFKPHSHTSNSLDDIGAPWVIYKASLTSESTGPIIPAYTKLGPTGLYSPYFGIVPDHGVGFVILSADTNTAADLNAYVDTISEYLIPGLERTAALQAATNFGGNYTGMSTATVSTVTLVLTVDGLGGLSVKSWTSNNSNGTTDVRAAYAKLVAIPAATLDVRLYPTNLEQATGRNGTKALAFRAVFQDIDAPEDGGTPLCNTWYSGVDALVWNGQALDEFVFEVDGRGRAVGVEIAAMGMRLTRR